MSQYVLAAIIGATLGIAAYFIESLIERYLKKKKERQNGLLRAVDDDPEKRD